MSIKGVPRGLRTALAGLMLSLLGGCAITPQKVTVPVASSVDLPRFMGPWYVIGVIPTFLERDIYNAIESYELAADGTISRMVVSGRVMLNERIRDALMRHLVDDAMGVPTDTDNVLHATKLAWRAMANLEKVLEARGVEGKPDFAEQVLRVPC